ncbi:phage tail protein [Erwinia sp. CPCC 100877]|nr:phage tail protein [Erwinia sp. CPCC 100877]
MYHYKDTKAEKSYEVQLPTSAMNYDGIWLEEVIEGYRTLSVAGREMISLDIQANDVGVGTSISSQRILPRTLKVNYQMRNNDSEMLMVNYRRLMEYLYREKDVPIYFNDEQDVIYYGRYSASAEVPGDRLILTGSFDVYCSDPRKYSFKTFEASETITSRFPLETRPDKITITVKRAGGLSITNGKQTIKISKNSLSAGDVVVFDFSGGQVIINGNNKTNWLDLNSDFENFRLEQSQNIICDNGDCILKYREVQL